MEQVNIIPTPRGYVQILNVLAKDGRKIDKVWAKLERERIQPAVIKGHWYLDY